MLQHSPNPCCTWVVQTKPLGGQPMPMAMGSHTQHSPACPAHGAEAAVLAQQGL